MPLEPMEELIRRNLDKFVVESGIAYTAIADTTGITAASFARYLKGENAVPAAALKTLADFFGRRVGDFYEEDPPPADPSLVNDLFLRSRPGAMIDADFMREMNALMAQKNAELRELKLKSPKTKPGKPRPKSEK